MTRAADLFRTPGERGLIDPAAGMRAYEAGRHRRDDLDFSPRAVGPNALADETLGLTKRRIRHLSDNNPLIVGARNIIRNNTVGTGIDVQPDTGDPDLDEQIEDVWKEHCRGVDPDRCQTMGASQSQFFEEVFSAGETLVHHVVAPAHRGYPESPAIELIDADRLDLSYSGQVRDGENRIRQSVELNAAGQRVGYHVLNQVPGEWFFGFALPGQRRRIDVANAELAFVPRRIGQLRGVPWPVAVVGAARMEDKFQEAYLMLARVAACVGVWIEGGDGEALLGNNSGGPTDAEGNPVTRMEPGLIGRLPHGATIKALGANIPPPSFEAASQVLLRRMAAGLSISYAALSRDYSRATFSATRAEHLEDRKGYRPLQLFVWHRHTRPHYERWLTWAIAANRIRLNSQQRRLWLSNRQRMLRVQIITPGWEWVNPQQEAQAAEISMVNGITTLADECSAHGRHWRDQIRQRLVEEEFEAKERERMGLAPRAAQPRRMLPPADDRQDDNDQEGDRRESARLKLAGANA